ncbi:MAG: 23S rRNA (uracil(1939)-C(5))-methyltransferase RlmD [Methanocella sp.]
MISKPNRNAPPTPAHSSPAAPRPGQTVEAEVTGLAHDGAGVGRLLETGYVLFIPGALPGERVEAQVEQAGPRSGRASLVRRLTTSPDRVPPEAQNCAVTEGCGGCSLGHLSYPAQLAFKTRRVTEALQRIARLPDVPVAPCLAAPLTEGYRNKMQYVVFAGRSGRAGRLRLGQLAARTHDPVPAEDCRLATPALRAAAAQVSEALTGWSRAFAPETPAVWPRHAVLREAAATGELMAILVTREDTFPGWDSLAADLRRRVPSLVSLVQLVNPRPSGPVVAGRRARVAGRAYLVERLGELTFHLSPESFLQVNPAQTLRLYEQVRAFAALTGTEDLLDVYCGIGTISLYLARSARHVTGIEIVPAAVQDASATARLNALANASFLSGPAERLLPDLARRGYHPDVVVLDPPRAGVAAEALAAVAALRPRRIVYVSCDPETLARDLRRLADSGYQVQAVQPVDMFPQTSHTEAVAVVTRE